MWKTCQEYVLRHTIESLDKIHQEYVIDWPGLRPAPGGGKGDSPHLPTRPEGCFAQMGTVPFSAPASDGYATGAGRFGLRSSPFFGWGPGAGSVSGENHPILDLVRAQTFLDPDTFGNYWLYFSPENPNFATSWWSPAYSYAAKCAGHPRFKDLAKLAEMKLREDLYHSVTLPGGAGQECPGYMAGALDHLRRNAQFCKENLGFDLTGDPRLRAAASFILHTSHPAGDGGRRSHPGGDTHPPGPNVFAYANTFGVNENPAEFVTEELPGFGVVFRNQPATPRETYLAFKSGPNRGHYHGDQLSFHYGAYGRMQLVDHHCSYKPRAGQEHMHNRVAFHTDKLPWANMDGYERVLAFKTSPDVDIAIGQVESERLRVTEKFPPEKWDTRLPQEVFDTPLKYRRTIVFLKGKDRDYFVIRDQHVGPDVFATYCLHGYGDKCEQRDRTFDFDGVSAFVASPKDFQVSSHDWQHANGEPEATRGLRLTTRGKSSEFITVLMPRPVGTVETVELVLKGAIPSEELLKYGKVIESKLDLHVGLRRRNGKVVAEPARFSVSDPRQVHGEGTPTITAAADGWKAELRAMVDPSRNSPGGKATYSIQWKQDGRKCSGAFKGTFIQDEKNGPGKRREISGPVAGELAESGFPAKVEYSKDPLPAMSAIPGGVKVGGDEIVFSGGVDEKSDADCVTVRRDGMSVATLSGREINLDRSQGEIGLFVPDAGYPFGVLPDWLVRQRCTRPLWYVDAWPLTAQPARRP
ncbi:MAG: hypothetical protein ABR915_02685 [Thermoguttaceae bacterium]